MGWEKKNEVLNKVIWLYRSKNALNIMNNKESHERGDDIS